ncbi:MAG TPA: 30S ribosomal protein S8 [Vicinamibacterales bacterium]|jgi:small subunit ribosomal protein S8|nr:30S ribosomal protein S8 [Vicinamibacterales bacterium]
MTMTDPIADMLTRVRNANQAFQDSTSMPSSKIKVRIAEILKTNGYISDFELTQVEGQVGDVLKVTLKYGESRERSIVGLRRISKPGLRVYAKSTELPKVLGGLGIAIISTSQGLLTDRDAKAKSVGGEVLAYVW